MLVVRDASNVITFDQTTPVLKMFGELQIGTSYTGAATNGTITDARFTSYGGHRSFFTRIDGAFSNAEIDAIVEISGNTLTWRYPQPPQYVNGFLYNRPNLRGVYGII